MEIIVVPTSWVVEMSKGDKHGTWKIVSIQYIFSVRG